MYRCDPGRALSNVVGDPLGRGVATASNPHCAKPLPDECVRHKQTPAHLFRLPEVVRAHLPRLDAPGAGQGGAKRGDAIIESSAKKGLRPRACASTCVSRLGGCVPPDRRQLPNSGRSLVEGPEVGYRRLERQVLIHAPELVLLGAVRMGAIRISTRVARGRVSTDAGAPGRNGLRQSGVRIARGMLDCDLWF